MTPQQTPAWGLNIDQMLQNLSSQPTWVVGEISQQPLPEVNLVPPVLHEEQVLQPSFSIENLVKPVSSPAPHIPEVQVLRTSLVPKWVKMIWSVVATFVVVVLGGWVISIQYPLETKAYTDKIFGVIDSVVATTENNIESNVILVENVIWTWNEEEVHGAAPENYIVDTPLADAMAQSQDLLAQDTTTENLLDTVVWETPTSFVDTGSEILPVSISPDFNLPSVTQPLTNTELQQQLLTLSQSSQEAMTNLIGNSDVKMAKMRAIYKSSQSLLVQVSDNSFVPDDEFREKVSQLQSLYDSTIVQ